MTTDSDPVIALSLLCRYRLTQLGSELASRLLLVQSGEQEGAERLAERRVPLLPQGAHLASPEPVAATRKRKSRKKSTSAVPESPTAVESSLSTYPTSSYRSTITTSPTLSTPSYSRYSSAAPRPASSSPLLNPSPSYTSSLSDTVSPTPAENQRRLVNKQCKLTNQILSTVGITCCRGFVMLTQMVIVSQPKTRQQ